MIMYYYYYYLKFIYFLGKTYFTYGTSKSLPSLSLQHSSSTKARTCGGISFRLTVSTTLDNLKIEK